MDTLDFIEDFLGVVGAGWDIPSALKLADKCQKEILGVDCDLMRIKGDPFFRTQDGVFEYSASECLFESKTGTPGAAITGNIRAVRVVYQALAGFFGGAYGFAIPHYAFLHNQDGNSLYRRTNTPMGELVRAPVDGVDCTSAELNNAKVLWNFRANPGTSTDTWQAIVYRWPATLSDVNIPLEIPDDYVDTLLMYAMIRKTECRNYGRNDYSEAMYQQDLKRIRGKYMGAAKEWDQVANRVEA